MKDCVVIEVKPAPDSKSSPPNIRECPLCREDRDSTHFANTCLHEDIETRLSHNVCNSCNTTLKSDGWKGCIYCGERKSSVVVIPVPIPSQHHQIPHILY